MRDYAHYDEFLESVLEIAKIEYEISKEEINYNDEHFLQCYEEGISAGHAVFLLSSFCL
tara:strand:+ start:1235 stop:1411 length:177 start_codon:yes stop_codon:yes gene_type:complete